MESLSLATVTMASILAMVSDQSGSQAKVSTHILPAIAGQWQMDLSENKAHELPASESSENSEDISKDLNDKTVNLQYIEIKPLTDLSQTTIIKKSITNHEDKAAQVNINVHSIDVTACRELYNFDKDNQLKVVSGKEISYGRYIVSHPEEGLPIMGLQMVYDNNAVDCSGNQVDQTGETTLSYVKLQGNKMQWCLDPKGEQCHVSLYRVLP